MGCSNSTGGICGPSKVSDSVQVINPKVIFATSKCFYIGLAADYLKLTF